MALYGRSFYGVDTYGAPYGVDFTVDPFIAVPDGYNSIRLTWTSPTGDWDSLRLIQSRTGFASHESDGLILVDSTHAVAEYKDTDLLDGAWYYYSIFIQANGDWNLVGTASALSVSRLGMADLLWDKTPRWFRYEPVNPDAVIKVWEPTAEVVDLASGWQENQTLKNFQGVLGWGLDYLRTYADTLMWANDTRQAHLANVYRLSQTLGEEWEPRVPAYLMRQKVQNAGVLAQKRGTLDGLHELLATSVGYDVDLSVGPNMFLSEDQAGFANPQYPQWDPGTNYAANDLVTSSGKVWKALIGTYGLAQQPPQDASTSNTWWTLISGTTTPAMVSDVLRDPVTGGIVTWKSFVGSTNKPLSVAYGVSDPYDQLSNASSALWVRNTDASTQSYTVVGAANPLTADSPTPSSDVAVLQGVPLPRGLMWDATVEYTAGDCVTFQGVSYKALRNTTGQRPDVNSQALLLSSLAERTATQFVQTNTRAALANYVGQTVTVTLELRTTNPTTLRVYPYQGTGISIVDTAYFKTTSAYQRFSFVTSIKDFGGDIVTYTNGAIGIYDDSAAGSNVYVRNMTVTRGDGSGDEWQQIGYDERLPFKFSFWTHAGFTGVDNTSATIPVTGNVLLFDGQGKALPTPTTSVVPLIDTFNAGQTVMNGRYPDVQPGSLAWATRAGTWRVVPKGDGTSSIAWPTGGTAQTLIDGSSLGWTAYRIAATFGKAPLQGTQAIIASCGTSTPTTSYTAVSRTKLWEQTSGVTGVSANLSSPIKDGDRVILDINSTTKVAKVYVNAETAPRAQITFTRTDTFVYGLMNL